MLSTFYSSHQTGSKAGPCSRLIRNSFMEAIKLLKKDGVLFQKSKTPQNMYYVSIESCIVFLASHYIYIQLLYGICWWQANATGKLIAEFENTALDYLK